MKKEDRKAGRPEDKRFTVEANPYHQPLTLTAAAHYHHEIGKSVSGPPTDPTHLPLTEAGTNRDRYPKAQELGFEVHSCGPLLRSTQSCLRGRAQSSGNMISSARFRLLIPPNRGMDVITAATARYKEHSNDSIDHGREGNRPGYNLA